jgi:hypothetical protein
MTRELWAALQKLKGMRSPSVASILKSKGYGHESGVVQEIVDATVRYENEVGQPSFTQ